MAIAGLDGIPAQRQILQPSPPDDGATAGKLAFGQRWIALEVFGRFALSEKS